MANYSSLKAAIEAAIKTNGNQEITGQVLQDVLTSIVSVIGANYTFAGVATPSTNPGTPDQNLTYLAMEGGTYTNFNGTVLPAGISLLMWNGTWTSETVMYGDGGVFDISVYKSSGGTLATYADLSAALDGGNNIPASARKGGMSVKYVQSSDNKYVQYRCMAQNFTTDVTEWINSEGKVNQLDQIVGTNVLEKSGTNVQSVDIACDFLTTGKEIEVTLLQDSYQGTINVGVYFIKQDSTTVYSGKSLNALNTPTKITCNGEYTKVRFYRNSGAFADMAASVRECGLIDDFNEFKQETTNDINNINENIGNVSLLKTSLNQNLTFTTEWLKSGNKIRIKLDNIQTTKIHVLVAYWVGGTSTTIATFKNIDDYIIYTLPVDADNITFYNMEAATTMQGTVSLYGLSDGIDCNKIDANRENFRHTTEDVSIYNAKVSTIPAKMTYEGTWVVNSASHKSMVVAVNPDSRIHLVGSLNQTAYALIKDIVSVPANGTNVPFVTGVEHPSIAVTNPHNFYPTADAKFLVVTIKQDGTDTTPREFTINGIDVLKNLRDALPGFVKSYNETINEIDTGKGCLDQTGINNVSSDKNYGYISIKDSARKSLRHNRVVAVNHDDLNSTDYVVTRKIYNKFGFNANFNFGLAPFTSVSVMEEKIASVKKMLKDGCELGLHDIFGMSYWLLNSLFDIKNDGTTTFAPSLSALWGENQDHTGINAFGTEVTPTSTFKDLGFLNCPNDVNKIVVSATQEDLIAVYRRYTVWGDLTDVQGVDLDGNVVTKKKLEWFEYWYNELIDSSLGYTTSYVPNLTTRYNDYTGTYPDKEHIMNGKMVFVEDVDNPHYNDEDYQKVGHFTTGLFKNCATCCNYEVQERIIAIATAFCRHYFGMVRFSNYGRHGEGYFSKAWSQDGIDYANVDKTFINNERCLHYISYKQKWESVYDSYLNNGVRMSMHGEPLSCTFEGQGGLIIGGKAFRGSFWNHIQGTYCGMINYFQLIGDANKVIDDTITYNAFMSYAPKDMSDWLRWAYENAGQNVSNGEGNNIKMWDYLKTAVDVIRSCQDTGKIPTLSFDTITPTPSVYGAMEVLCKFCYDNDIDIVPMEVARRLAEGKRDVSGNIFPNPSFNQMVLNALDGTSTSNDAYIPDGWHKESGNGIFGVTTEDGNRVLSIEGVGGNVDLRTRIFGLPAGTYKFSCYVKTTNEIQSPLQLTPKYNYEKTYSSGTPIETASINTEYTLVEKTFDIALPHWNKRDRTVLNQYCMGYEDNLSYIMVTAKAETGKVTKIYNPKLVFIG